MAMSTVSTSFNAFALVLVWVLLQTKIDRQQSQSDSQQYRGCEWTTKVRTMMRAWTATKLETPPPLLQSAHEHVQATLEAVLGRSH